MKSTLSACLVSQEEFDEYTTVWAQQLSDPGPVPLSTYFATPNGKSLLTHVYLTAEDVIHLISTVGTVTVKARFAIQPVDGQPTFTVILFGADARNTRTTAYLAATVPGAKSPVRHVAVAEGPVPNCLAMQWITNWQQQPEKKIDRTLFEAPDGPLRGYTFLLADFLDTLFPLTEITGEYLRLSFALHQYYKPGPVAEAAAATFGLVLDMSITPTLRDLEAGDLFYDISMPCPSTC